MSWFKSISKRREAHRVIRIQVALGRSMTQALYMDAGSVRILKGPVLQAWVDYKWMLKTEGLYDTEAGLESRRHMRKLVLKLLKETKT